VSMEKKVQAKHIKDRTILEAISNAFGGRSIPSLFDDRYPEKVVMAKLQKMRDQGLTDFGVHSSRPWLTAKGIRRLEELRGLPGSADD
jgi:hypothetical protein